MKRLFIILFAIAVMFSFTYCATTPPEEEEPEVVEEPAEEPAEEEPAEEPEVEEEEPEVVEEPAAEEPAEEPTEEPVEEEPEIEPITSAEIAEAENALKEAQWARAPEYSSDLYETAKNEFINALHIKDDDPERARYLLSRSKRHAKSSFNAAINAQIRLYAERFTQRRERLLEINADKFRPQKAQEYMDRFNTIVEKAKERQFLEAKEMADRLLADLSSFYDQLKEAIVLAEETENTTERLLKQAEREGADTWAESIYGEAEALFEAGQAAYTAYDLEKSIGFYNRSQSKAVQSAELAAQRFEKFTWYKNRLTKEVRKLREIEAEQYRPDESERLYGLYDRTRDALRKNRYDEAQQFADGLLANMQRLYTQLQSDLQLVDSAKSRAEDSLQNAREKEAPQWAENLFDQAVALLSEAEETFDRYNIEKSIDFFRQSRSSSAEAAKIALQRQEEYRWYVSQLGLARNKLGEIEAEKYRPEKTEEIDRRIRTAAEAVEKGQYADAREKADTALEQMNTLYTTLSEKIRWARTLKNDAENNRTLAKKADAPRWTPEDYMQGETYYEQGVKNLSNYHLDPAIDDFEKAKYFFAMATRGAPDRENAYEAYLVKIEELKKKLDQVRAVRYEPEKTQKVMGRVEETKDLYLAGKHLEAREQANQLIDDIEAFYQELSSRIQYAQAMQQSAEEAMDDAAEVEAYIWADRELARATMLYTEGIGALRNFNLDKGIAILDEAKKVAIKAAELAPLRKEEYETESLMEEVRQDIEEASDMTIMTEEGEIILPEKERRERQADEESTSQSSIKPSGPYIAVLGDVSEADLLSQAKDLWLQGVEERNKGNLQKAQEYFKEAGKLTHKYKSLSIGTAKIYTIQRSNNLWEIAGGEYKNPLLWPLIWVLNMEKIRDPDLIHPRWEIYIPAQ